MNRTIILIAVVLLPFVLSAQPGGGDPGGGDPDVPISGIEILITLGGLFGVRRFLGKRKSK